MVQGWSQGCVHWNPLCQVIVHHNPTQINYLFLLLEAPLEAAELWGMDTSWREKFQQWCCRYSRGKSLWERKENAEKDKLWSNTIAKSWKSFNPSFSLEAEFRLKCGSSQLLPQTSSTFHYLGGWGEKLYKNKILRAGFCSSQMQTFPVYPFYIISFCFPLVPANLSWFVIQWEPSSPTHLFLGDLLQVGWWLLLGEFLLADEGRKEFGSVWSGAGLQQREKEKMKPQAVNVHPQNCQYHSREISPMIKAAKGTEHQMDLLFSAFFFFVLSHKELKSCLRSEMGNKSESGEVWRMRKANKVNSSEQQQVPGGAGPSHCWDLLVYNLFIRGCTNQGAHQGRKTAQLICCR